MSPLTNSTGYRGDPTVIWVPELQAYLGAHTDGSDSGTTAGVTLYESPRLEDLFQSTTRYTVPASGGGAEAPGLIEWTDPATGVTSLYIGYQDQNNVHQAVMNTHVTDPFCQKTANCWTQMTLIKAANALPSRDWAYFIHGGQLWTVYENNLNGYGGVNVQLLINPNNIDTTRAAVQISSAIPPNGSGNNKAQARIWEFRHNEMNGTNEAPVAFSHVDANGKLLTFITYSANSYRFGDYDMGLLTFAGGANDPLDVASQWTKSQNPIFQALNYSTTVGAQEWVLQRWQ